jgi:hypothetical protein
VSRAAVKSDRLQLRKLRRHALANPLSRADVDLDPAFFRDDPLRFVRIGLTVKR